MAKLYINNQEFKPYLNNEIFSFGNAKKENWFKIENLNWHDDGNITGTFTLLKGNKRITNLIGGSYLYLGIKRNYGHRMYHADARDEVRNWRIESNNLYGLSVSIGESEQFSLNYPELNSNIKVLGRTKEGLTELFMDVELVLVAGPDTGYLKLLAHSGQQHTYHYDLEYNVI